MKISTRCTLTLAGVVVAALVTACGASDDFAAPSTADYVAGWQRGRGLQLELQLQLRQRNDDQRHERLWGQRIEPRIRRRGRNVERRRRRRRRRRWRGRFGRRGRRIAGRESRRPFGFHVDAAPAAPALRWLGRFESVPNATRFDWPGTGFVARFSGTARAST